MNNGFNSVCLILFCIKIGIRYRVCFDRVGIFGSRYNSYMDTHFVHHGRHKYFFKRINGSFVQFQSVRIDSQINRRIIERKDKIFV